MDKVNVYVTPENTIGLSHGECAQDEIDSAINITVEDAKKLVRDLQEAIVLAENPRH